MAKLFKPSIAQAKAKSSIPGRIMLIFIACESTWWCDPIQQLAIGIRRSIGAKPTKSLPLGRITTADNRHL